MIIGFDPGLTGGWGVLTADGKYCRADLMPTHPGLTENRREIDVRALFDSLQQVLGNQPPSLVVIERVGPIRTASLISTWTFARTYESLVSLAKLTRWPYILVRPQDWKEELLRGTDKSKRAAIQWCKQRWPCLSGLRAEDDGIAEALLMAEYGRRTSYPSSAGDSNGR
jgi:Holliday junction resolvasome RuvABC endonuclease subunit